MLPPSCFSLPIRLFSEVPYCPTGNAGNRVFRRNSEPDVTLKSGDTKEHRLGLGGGGGGTWVAAELPPPPPPRPSRCSFVSPDFSVTSGSEFLRNTLLMKGISLRYPFPSLAGEWTGSGSFVFPHTMVTYSFPLQNRVERATSEFCR